MFVTPKGGDGCLNVLVVDSICAKTLRANARSLAK